MQRLPVLRSRLSTVHTVVDERRGRGPLGVTARLFPLDDTETTTVGDLVLTSPARPRSTRA